MSDLPLRATVIRLDRDYTLLSARGFFEELNRPHLGRNLWDVYPDARHRLEPVCGAAWQYGRCYRVVPHHGCAVAVHANIHTEDTLLVQFTVLPLDGLRETIEALLNGGPVLEAHRPPHEDRCATVIPLRRRATG